MKIHELKPFQELHHTDKLLRLDWFGGVKCNLEENDNPLVECIFTPFELPDPATGITTPKPKRHDQFMTGIAVGYLPILFIGQFFRHGKWAPLNEWPPAETITFDLDVSDTSAVTEGTLPNIQLDPPSDFISPHFKDTANRAGIKRLHGTLRRSSNKKINEKIKKTLLPQDVFIHEMEIIRYYLTNSSHSCKNIFTGAFTKKKMGDRVVNELHEKVTFDSQTGAGRFVYRHGYKEKDAPILGRILFEPNALALNASQRVNSKMTADRINSEPNWLGYPRTLFPFVGRTQLVLSGRRLKTATGYIFLAYRIHSCSAPFPYMSLSYCDEIAPGGAPAPYDAPVAFPGQRATDKGPAHGDKQGKTTGQSTSGERPNAASVQLQIEMGKREYLGLVGVPICKEKLRDCTHRSEKKPSRYLDSLLNASTGGGTSGESSATRQSLTERIVTPSSVTPDLETFIKVIKGLRTLHPDWGVSTIIVGAGSESDGEQTSYFPEIACQKRVDTMRQFSYTDDAKLERRRFICVQIRVNGRYIYLFEAQRRLRFPPPPPDAQSPYKESLPVLLLYASSYEEVQSDDFLPMIEQTVKNKTWPNEGVLNGFIRDHTVHGQGVQSVDEMCARVAQLIQRNLEK